jgi:hypothetical protein
MANCNTNCGAQGNVAAVSNIQRLHEIMAPIIDSGIPLQALKPLKGYGLTPFLFEIDYLDDGEEILKMKNGLGSIGVNPKVDPSDGAVVWDEMGTTTRQTKVVGEVAIGATSVVLEDASIFGTLTANHTLLFPIGNGVFEGRVASVDYTTNTITLAAGSSVAIPDATCVKKGKYNRHKTVYLILKTQVLLVTTEVNTNLTSERLKYLLTLTKVLTLLLVVTPTQMLSEWIVL